MFYSPISDPSPLHLMPVTGASWVDLQPQILRRARSCAVSPWSKSTRIASVLASFTATYSTVARKVTWSIRTDGPVRQCFGAMAHRQQSGERGSTTTR
jgi:hypothetical protein